MVKFDPSLFISRSLIDQEIIQNSKTFEIIEELQKKQSSLDWFDKGYGRKYTTTFSS